MTAAAAGHGKRKMLRVTPIHSGTVIDHIQAGRALKVLQILGLPEEGTSSTISIAINVRGRKATRKDVVKVEDRELAAKEVDRIALIAPEATINIIRDFEVAEKKRVVLPDEIRDILRCSNPNCITNKMPREPLCTRFRVVSRAPVQLKCHYCNRRQENFVDNVI